MCIQMFFDKILILLDPSEKIEYVRVEKNKENDCILLTNKKIIYTNSDLLNKSVFNFLEIKKSNTQKIERIKMTLQSNDFEIKSIVSKHFNIKD